MLTLEQAQTLPITPVKVKDLPAFLRAVEPIARELADGDLLAAMTRHADGVIAATAIGAGVPRAELDEATPDVLVVLATRVLEVNADFFARQVLPLMTAAAEKIGSISGQPLTTGSSGSAAPASGTTR